MALRMTFWEAKIVSIWNENCHSRNKSVKRVFITDLQAEKKTDREYWVVGGSHMTISRLASFLRSVSFQSETLFYEKMY